MVVTVRWSTRTGGRAPCMPVASQPMGSATKKRCAHSPLISPCLSLVCLWCILLVVHTHLFLLPTLERRVCAHTSRVRVLQARRGNWFCESHHCDGHENPKLVQKCLKCGAIRRVGTEGAISTIACFGMIGSRLHMCPMLNPFCNRLPPRNTQYGKGPCTICGSWRQSRQDDGILSAM